MKRTCGRQKVSTTTKRTNLKPQHPTVASTTSKLSSPQNAKRSTASKRQPTAKTTDFTEPSTNTKSIQLTKICDKFITEDYEAQPPTLDRNNLRVTEDTKTTAIDDWDFLKNHPAWDILFNVALPRDDTLPPISPSITNETIMNNPKIGKYMKRYKKYAKRKRHYERLIFGISNKKSVEHLDKNLELDSNPPDSKRTRAK